MVKNSNSPPPLNDVGVGCRCQSGCRSQCFTNCCQSGIFTLTQPSLGVHGECSRKEKITSESATVVWRKMPCLMSGGQRSQRSDWLETIEATGTQITAAFCQGLQTCVSEWGNLHNLEAQVGRKKKKYSVKSRSLDTTPLPK